MLTTTKYLDREPRDFELLEDPIVKLFQQASEIDIRTCTEGEWAERIAIICGALKRLQLHRKPTKDKEIMINITLTPQ